MQEGTGQEIEIRFPEQLQGCYKWAPMGLEIVGNPSFPELDLIRKELGKGKKAIELGEIDVDIKGENLHGEMWSQTYEGAESTRKKRKRALEDIPISRRRHELDISHYVEARSIENLEERLEVLGKAADGGWTIKQLREAVGIKKGTITAYDIEKAKEEVWKKLDTIEEKLGEEGYYKFLCELLAIRIEPDKGRIERDLKIEPVKSCSCEKEDCGEGDCEKEDCGEVRIEGNGNVVEMNAQTRELVEKHLKKGD